MNFIRLFKITLFVLPILVVIPLINYWIDPANLFVRGNGIESGIAALNSSGWNVAIPLSHADYDERILHSYIIQSFDKSHDTLVMGSSRIRQITRENFFGDSFYNFASASGNLEDFWSYYSLYRDKNFKPTRIVLGMEHWMLDRDPGYPHWKTLASVYYRAISKRGFIVPDNFRETETRYSLEKTLQLFSLSYFQASIDAILNTKKTDPGEKFYATREAKARDGEWLQCYDGTAGERVHPRTVEEVRLKVSTVDDGVSPLREIDDSRVSLLLGFIELVQSEDIEIIFFLPPVHPITYKKWKKNDKGADRAEAFYRKLAADKNITVVGSYNPSIVQAKEEDFMDWVHPRRKAVTKLFKQI